MPVRHVVGILIRPGSTWLALRDEPLGQGEIFRRLVAPLALIGPVCGSIGLLVFGPGIAGIRLQPSPTATLAAAGLSYVLTLVAAYVLAFVIGGLAPMFGGAGGRGQALKLVA